MMECARQNNSVEKKLMLQQNWRGRSPNNILSYKDRKILKYLARIAMTNNVDSSEFFNCIVKAWNHEESECVQLVITCRSITKNSAIFLFTNGRKVVAQFSISNTILQEKNQLESYMKTILAKTSLVKNLKGLTLKIRDLKAGMKKVSLKAKVFEVSKSKMVYTRWGTEAHVSNAVIRDKTGSMIMGLWNQQINMVHKGDVINIKDGNVAWFRGEPHLRLGKHGSLSVIE
jgi:replication factor A1